jgi:hypothetical protein
MGSLESDMIKPSILPFASISILRTSLSKNHLKANDHTISVFIGNLFNSIDDRRKKWCTISGIMIPIALVFDFFKLSAMLLGL